MFFVVANSLYHFEVYFSLFFGSHHFNTHSVVLPDDVLAQNFKNLNTNNSDIDICEYEGKTYIIYASGNQGNTWGGLACEAVYDGSLNEFLEANFT